MRHREIDSLLGRTYACSFRVDAVGGVPPGGNDTDRRVTLWHMGERAEITLGELWALIETGFVAETTSLEPERSQDVMRYATALVETTRRYLAGYLSRPEWREHAGGLWRRVDGAGLRQQVQGRIVMLAEERERELLARGREDVGM
jgi:hypothetical protein